MVAGPYASGHCPPPTPHTHYPRSSISLRHPRRAREQHHQPARPRLPRALAEDRHILACEAMRKALHSLRRCPGNRPTQASRWLPGAGLLLPSTTTASGLTIDTPPLVGRRHTRMPVVAGLLRPGRAPSTGFWSARAY
jgi:hypothetical protein